MFQQYQNPTSIGNPIESFHPPGPAVIFFAKGSSTRAFVPSLVPTDDELHVGVLRHGLTERWLIATWDKFFKKTGGFQHGKKW